MIGFQRILLVADYFKSYVGFYYNRSSRISTYLGGIISLSIYALILYQFSQSDIFQRKQPFVVNQKISAFHASPIEFNQQNIFYFHVADAANTAMIDLSYFRVVAQKRHLKVNPSGLYDVVSIEDIPLKICDPSDPEDPQLYYQLGMMNSFCFVNKSFRLEGYWDETEIEFLSLGLFYCDNTTSNVTCKNLQQIDDYFTKELFFGVFHHSSYTDANDYENPIKKRVANSYQSIDMMLWKVFNIFIKKNKVVTDDGWLFHNAYTREDFMFDRVQPDIGTRFDKQNSPLFMMYFYAMADYELCNRRYQNMDDILGGLMGAANILFFLGGILVTTQSKIQLINKIMNSLYTFYKKKKRLDQQMSTKGQSNSSILEKKEKKSKKELKLGLIIENSIEMNSSKHDSKPQTQKENAKDSDAKPHQIHPKRGLKIEKKQPEIERSFVLEHYSLEEKSPKLEEPEFSNNANTDVDNKESLPVHFRRRRRWLSRKPMKLKSLSQISVSQSDSPSLKINTQSPKIPNRTDAFSESSLPGTSKIRDSHKSQQSESPELKIEKIFAMEKNSEYKIDLWTYLIGKIRGILNWRTKYEQRLFERTEKVFAQEMDIISFLQKLHEVEKIKMILLNKKQRELLRMIAKPLINVEEGPPGIEELDLGLRKSYTCSQKMQKHRRRTLTDDYEWLKMDAESNKTSKRLLKLVREEIKLLDFNAISKIGTS